VRMHALNVLLQVVGGLLAVAIGYWLGWQKT
jgi:fluoride ion exporter CrcB/FEX